jgi:hypothetical protein
MPAGREICRFFIRLLEAVDFDAKIGTISMARNVKHSRRSAQRPSRMASHNGNGRASAKGSGLLEDHLVKLAVSGKLAGAARSAIRAQKKLGLPVTFKRGNQVVKVFANGREEILETLNRPAYKLPKGVAIIRKK